MKCCLIPVKEPATEVQVPLEWYTGIILGNYKMPRPYTNHRLPGHSEYIPGDLQVILMPFHGPNVVMVTTLPRSWNAKDIMEHEQRYKVNPVATYINKRHEIFGPALLVSLNGDFTLSEFGEMHTKSFRENVPIQFMTGPTRTPEERLVVARRYIEAYVSGYAMTLETAYILIGPSIAYVFVLNNWEYVNSFKSHPVGEMLFLSLSGENTIPCPVTNYLYFPQEFVLTCRDYDQIIAEESRKIGYIPPMQTERDVYMDFARKNQRTRTVMDYIQAKLKKKKTG